MGGHHSVSINGRKMRVVKQVAEGGFAFVFIVKDVRTKELYALKQIHCSVDEQIRNAKWEIQVHKKVDHPNVMKLVDAQIVQSQAGRETKDALLLLPLYQKGSLQSLIEEADKQDKSAFSERLCLRIFFELCLGVLALHKEKLAHRDIKPANVLLTSSDDFDNVQPILTDLGSVSPAKVHIHNRQEALMLQESAAVMSSASYRAPELHNVPNNQSCVDTTQADVWSMGCTLWAMAFGAYGPFDSPREGVLTLNIMSGQAAYPADRGFSTSFIDLIKWMLCPDWQIRPSLDKVVEQVSQLHAVAAQILVEPSPGFADFSEVCISQQATVEQKQTKGRKKHNTATESKRSSSKMQKGNKKDVEEFGEFHSA